MTTEHPAGGKVKDIPIGFSGEAYVLANPGLLTEFENRDEYAPNDMEGWGIWRYKKDQGLGKKAFANVEIPGQKKKKKIRRAKRKMVIAELSEYDKVLIRTNSGRIVIPVVVFAFFASIILALFGMKWLHEMAQTPEGVPRWWQDIQFPPIIGGPPQLTSGIHMPNWEKLGYNFNTYDMQATYFLKAGKAKDTRMAVDELNWRIHDILTGFEPLRAIQSVVPKNVVGNLKMDDALAEVLEQYKQKRMAEENDECLADE